MADEILLDVADDGVALLKLNRPQRRNAMDHAMGDALATAVDRVNADDRVRAVVLAATGEGFSAGGDFSLFGDLAAGDPGAATSAMIAFYRKYLRVRALAVPSVAAVQGAAIGAGACLALACDLRVAADDARFGFTFVRLGLHPGMAATWLLPRAVGHAHAVDLLATGRIVGAAEAARIGLCERVVPRAQLAEEARALAREIAGSGPLAVRRLVAGLEGRREDDDALARALAWEAESQAACMRTRDFQEGVRAILERRPPRFEGR